jgi:putative spermidine/putrescine transport system permease protein
MTAATEVVGAGRRWWLYLIASLVALVLVLPILIIVPMSFTDSAMLRFPPTSLSLRWYRSFFGSDVWMEAAGVSLLSATVTMAVATASGTLAAYAAHTVPQSWARVIWLLMMAPLIVPIVLIGVGLYFTFAPLKLTNTVTGIVLGHSMHAVPFVFLTVIGALRQLDMNQPRVAQSLGASPALAFATVTLPQIRLSVAGGAFLAFLSSFDEVVIALFVSGGSVQTLPKLMFNELHQSLDPTIAAISSLSLTAALLFVALRELLVRRGVRIAHA